MFIVIDDVRFDLRQFSDRQNSWPPFAIVDGIPEEFTFFYAAVAVIDAKYSTPSWSSLMAAHMHIEAVKSLVVVITVCFRSFTLQMRRCNVCGDVLFNDVHQLFTKKSEVG